MGFKNDLNSSGYTVLKNYLNQEQITKYLEITEKVVADVGANASAPPNGSQKIIKNDRIVNNIHFHSEEFLDLISNGSHINILAEFLNDEGYGVIPKDKPNFILAQCNCRESSTALPYHVDVRLKLPTTQSWSMQCILALEDRTSKNGGLTVIEGSHLSDFIPADKLNRGCETFINLKAGDMVIFHSHLHHATTELGHGEKPGWGLLLTYRSWWCKPQFDFMKMFSQVRIEQMDDVKKTLLGYYSQPPSDCFASPSARQGYSSG